jgi:hypothetical protein
MKSESPTDKQLQKALNTVLTKHHTVPSQHRLQHLVSKQLNAKSKKKYGVNPQRLRALALDSGNVTLEIHSREGDPKKILHKCPVCGNSLQRVKNLTIWGGEVTIQFRCSNCGYWTGKKKRIPTRYVFHFKK